MAETNAIRDLLTLLHEEWLDDDRKAVIKNLLADMVDRMEDNMSLEDLR